VLSSGVKSDLHPPHGVMTTLAMPHGLPSAVPTKLLPGRPTLIRKRINPEEASSPSLAKKLKVSFSSNVEIRVVGEWEKTPELIQEEVGQALEKHARGDDSSYLDIKAIYSAEKHTKDVPSTTALRNYTAALLSNVSSLNKSCSELVYAVLNSPWLGRSEEYVNLYIRFLANLVSAHGVYLADTLRMLVENLTTGESSSAKTRRYNPKIP
jgi:RNA polymerase I-specific transcription initiation factor RRN3